MAVFYTRPRHGSLPVYVEGDGESRCYRLMRGHQRELYGSVRALLRALHGGQESGYSFDRYFKVGRFARPCGSDLVAHSILEMFGPPTGIDVAEKAEDIARIFYSHFGSAASSYGYSLPDLLQDVYRAVLVRNKGKCPFDQNKGTFGHYVWRVCVCVFRNHHKREQRRRGRFVVGCRRLQGSEWVDSDVAEAAVTREAADHDGALMELKEVSDDLLEWLEYQPDALSSTAGLAREALPLVLSGMRRSEIAETLGRKRHTVGYALAYLRRVTREWREEIVDQGYVSSGDVTA